MSHRIDSGLLVDGVIVGGADFVLRDSRAWWQPGERGTKRRSGLVTQLVGHWTAGQPHVGPDAAFRVTRNMRGRVRTNGQPLSVGIHFVISWDGLVFQTCDLSVGTVHVGSSYVNSVSVGVECCWPGTYAQAQHLKVDGHAITRRVDGARVECLRPSEELITSWTRLAELLASLPLSTKITIPRYLPEDRGAPGVISTKRLDLSQQRKWRGVLEHLHVLPTSKSDAGGLLLDALQKKGWHTASV